MYFNLNYAYEPNYIVQSNISGRYIGEFSSF